MTTQPSAQITKPATTSYLLGRIDPKLLILSGIAFSILTVIAAIACLVYFPSSVICLAVAPPLLFVALCVIGVGIYLYNKKPKTPAEAFMHEVDEVAKTPAEAFMHEVAKTPAQPFRHYFQNRYLQDESLADRQDIIRRDVEAARGANRKIYCEGGRCISVKEFADQYALNEEERVYLTQMTTADMSHHRIAPQIQAFTAGKDPVTEIPNTETTMLLHSFEKGGKRYIETYVIYGNQKTEVTDRINFYKITIDIKNRRAITTVGEPLDLRGFTTADCKEDFAQMMRAGDRRPLEFFEKHFGRDRERVLNILEMGSIVAPPAGDDRLNITELEKLQQASATLDMLRKKVSETEFTPQYFVRENFLGEDSEKEMRNQFNRDCERDSIVYESRGALHACKVSQLPQEVQEGLDFLDNPVHVRYYLTQTSILAIAADLVHKHEYVGFITALKSMKIYRNQTGALQLDRYVMYANHDMPSCDKGKLWKITIDLATKRAVVTKGPTLAFDFGVLPKTFGFAIQDDSLANQLAILSLFEQAFEKSGDREHVTNLLSAN